MAYWLIAELYDSDTDKAPELLPVVLSKQSIFFSQSLQLSKAVYENNDRVSEVWESQGEWTHTMRVIICIPEKVVWRPISTNKRKKNIPVVNKKW